MGVLIDALRERDEAADAAAHHLVVKPEQFRRRNEHVQSVGQGLAVAADHLVADIGQTDGTDQEFVEMLLFIDDRVAELN